MLPSHQARFAPFHYGHTYGGRVDFSIYYDLAMFMHREVDLRKHGEVFIHGNWNGSLFSVGSIGRNLQYMVFGHDGKEYTVAHFHGLWTGQGKKDTPERIEQSRKVRRFLDQNKEPKILCGDFNLLPDTESVRILEEGGLVNLIKTHGITSTRSRLYQKPEKFADYTLVSPEVVVERFEVPEFVVSDHLPMVLEYH